MEELDYLSIILLIGFGFCLGGLFDSIFFQPDIGLSQESGNDVCINLTNNSNAVAVFSGEAKLICEIPSYDSTTNIIIRPAGQGSGE